MLPSPGTLLAPIASLDARVPLYSPPARARQVNVSLLEEVSTGDVTMTDVAPLSALPGCVQQWLQSAKLADLTVTAPANPEEMAQFAKEQKHHPVNAVGHTLRERQQRRRSKTHRHYGARDARKTYRAWSARRARGRRAGAEASSVYALGDTTTELEVNRTLANPIPRHHEAVFAQSLPSSYDPTEGTPCVADYEARQQGSCGSCYAFAASTALALQARAISS